MKTEAAATVTLESVTDWTWTEQKGYRGRIPNMPSEEREMLKDLWAKEGKPMSRDEKLLKQALERKMKYIASREINDGSILSRMYR